MKNQSDEESLLDLRSRATAKVASGDYSALAEKDRFALVHELSVHQIELELQNEELRRAHVEAQELYERFQDLYNFAPVCYFTLENSSSSSRILEANLTAATYLGVERSSLLNTSFKMYLKRSSWAVFSDFVAELLASGGRQRCEVQLGGGKRASSHAIIEGVVATREETGAKEVRIALTDITELRRAEEALKKLNDELETKARERTAELREKDRLLLLQSRQAAMGEMIGNIAHQWRQPLNGLGLILQSLLILEEKETLRTEILEETVRDGMELITHLSGTIDDFRNYFKPDREKVPFRLEQAVTRSIGLIGASFRDRRIAVDVVRNGDPLVIGFPNEFSQALLNILLNAKDAFEERGVSAPRLVIVVDETNDGKGVVTITDNAGGIPEDIIDKVFDPYFTTKSPNKGTGVGLFMAKSIIEKNMGGRLTVRNTGEGAEFRIVI
ncbi:MAG TPA: HAMP domain-containing sensor histidine kinase [Geobacteraceae bacterium]